MKLRLLAMAAAVLSLMIVADAAAQGFPGRDRRGSPREMGQNREARRDVPGASVPDPYAALERELPSLQVDLQIRAGQLDDWRAFERNVRDIAEIERARRRHLMALRDEGEKSPTAVTFIASLAEDDRLKAETAAEARRHLEALYAKLDDAQRRTLDRRIIQSQTEPLGSERPRAAR